MKQVLFLAVTLTATLAIQTTANASYTDDQNKKRWAVQERIYDLSQELYMRKHEMRMQLKEEKRREKYRQAVEDKKGLQEGVGNSNKDVIRERTHW